METELGTMGEELNMIVNIILTQVDPYIQKYGDDGWAKFCPIWSLASEKAMQDVIGDKHTLKTISEDKNSYLSNWMLLSDFVDRTRNNQEIPRELNIWVALGLEKILKGEPSIEAFNLKKKRGPQVLFSKKLQLACYHKYLMNNNRSFDDACVECGEKWDIDSRTAAKWISDITIPNISNKTLETISRIDLSPLF